MLLVVFILYILVCTLSPFTFSLEPSRSLYSLYDEKFDTYSVFWSLPAWDVFTNILLFVPFGFLFVALPVLSPCRHATQILYSAMSACGLSFLIESCQLFLPRAPSMVDIFLNTVGGMTGAMIAIYAHVPITRCVRRHWLNIQKSPWLSRLILGYAMAVLVPSAVGLPLVTTFKNWEPHHTFELLEGIITGRYKWAYWFLVIFPMGFLFYLLFSRNKGSTGKAVFFSILIGLTVLVVIEGLQVITLRREVDLFFISIGTGIVLLSILSSSILSQRARVS